MCGAAGSIASTQDGTASEAPGVKREDRCVRGSWVHLGWAPHIGQGVLTLRELCDSLIFVYPGQRLSNSPAGEHQLDAWQTQIPGP